MTKGPSGTQYDDDDFDTLCKAVGFVVIVWGQAEQTLDIIVNLLHEDLGGKHLRKRRPHMLGDKLEYLRLCLAQIPRLEQCKNDGASLITKFNKLTNQRHDLIHGAISSLVLENGAFRFMKLEFKNPPHIVSREFRFEVGEFPLLADQLNDLSSTATRFGVQLVNLKA